MHGRAQGHHHAGDILVDAGLGGFLQVGGDGGDGGAGAEGHHRGTGQVLEHDADGALAAAEPGEEGEGGEEVDKAEGIVDQHGPAVAFEDLGAVGRDQVGEDGEEGDGGVVGDDLNELQHHVGEAQEPLAHGGFLAAGHLHGEAEEHGEDDEGQHGPAAEEAHEVLRREEVHDHLRQGGVLAHLLTGKVTPGYQHGGEELHEDEHDDGGDGAGDDEGRDGGAHDLAGPVAALHPGDGAGDGGEDQRHHDAEHHVDENLAQEGDLMPGVRPEPAHQGTGYHAGQQNGQEAVVPLDGGMIQDLLAHALSPYQNERMVGRDGFLRSPGPRR